MTSTYSLVTVLGARDVRITEISLPNVTPSSAIEIKVIDDFGMSCAVTLHIMGLPQSVIDRLLGTKS